ncbi:aminomethyltransferase [Chromatiales bacterium (ex Bugula neritina AB1)]|nr:aminomethyltransferase [Chromatiales bacterium (ex Bugula neritina AB1)]
MTEESLTSGTSGILHPGINSLPKGLERYPLQAGGLLVVDLKPGDELKVIDPEGLQPCEVAVFDESGTPRPEALQHNRPVTSQSRIAGMLAVNSENIRSINLALNKRNINSDNLKSIRFIEGETTAGHCQAAVCDSLITCLVAAPATQMPAHEQLPPTDLLVYITRANPEELPAPALPEPLAEPILDLRIERCTSRAYTVKAGDYIQVIDVEGRECSDFQCFDLAKLEQGIERCLDATTTRTLMAKAYPQPGLHAKFYDQDMNPMVEVIRDTCGRHDTFGLACTAKYYDDAGYPGHVNCSDNFNRTLAPFEIESRPGWMAMNFFFNTGYDDHNQLFSDEPWSRPGDYVLMRALKDLVCVSSACPDDIDPANGWNPTDIHVRVYPAKNEFSTAVAYRMTPDAEPQLTKETAFHSRTSKLTGNFVEYNGYWLANRFNNHGPINEYWACRDGVAVIDLSPLRKYEVLGPDAEELLQTCVTRDVRRLSPGQVVYTAMCYENGGMVDDGTVFRMCENNFRWVGGSDYSGIWLRQQAQIRNLNCWVKSSTGQLHNLQVQGPKSRDVLKKIIWTRPDQTPLEDLAWFRFSVARIGHDQGTPILVSRTGYTGELGYEVWCHPKDGAEVWDAIMEAGKQDNITPLGLEALDMLRIEAGLIFADYEFSDETDPYEAGISFTVPLKSKTDDFIGRNALVKRKENPQKKLVGLELHGDEMAAHGDCVHIGRQQIGVITSATRSPKLSKNIALCRLTTEHSEPGTEVEVGKLDGHQKRLPATVVSYPFYDPTKSRVRA